MEGKDGEAEQPGTDGEHLLAAAAAAATAAEKDAEPTARSTTASPGREQASPELRGDSCQPEKESSSRPGSTGSVPEKESSSRPGSTGSVPEKESSSRPGSTGSVSEKESSSRPGSTRASATSPPVGLRPSSTKGSRVSPAPPVDGTRPPSNKGSKVGSTTPSGGTSSKHGRRNRSADPEAHKVTFTVTIAQAIPTGLETGTLGEESVEDEDQADPEKMKKRKRVAEAPHAQNYFHCQYSLLPQDDSLTKTDVVTFGLAAKIYTERHEPKVLRTWQDGEVTWVAWTHTHTVTVTDELLQKLVQHTVELRVWDTKDKLSTRARYDRPKAFKLPQAKPGEDADTLGGVKAMVMKQSSDYAEMMPKCCYIDKPLPCQPRDAGQAANAYADNPRGKRVTLSAQREGRDALPDSLTDQPPSWSGVRRPAPPGGSPTPSTLRPVHKSSTDTGQQQQQKQQQQPQQLRSYSRLGRLAGLKGSSGAANEDKPHPSGGSQPGQSKAGRKSAGSKKAASATPSGTKADKGSQPVLPAISSDAQYKQLASSSAPVSGSMDVGSSLAKLPEHPHAQPSRTCRSVAGGRTRSKSPCGAQEAASMHRNKKVEAQVQAQQEHAKKYGVCCLPLNMAKLFAGQQTVTERLGKPVPTVDDLFLTISLSGPLMSDEQKHRLNPLVIRVIASSGMPTTPLAYADLRLKCQPACVRYSLFDEAPHQSVSREQSELIYWGDVHVVLAGTLEPATLKQYLHGPPLLIEVHDRDRLMEKHALKPTLFGDDLEDEKIGNVGAISSKRTTYNPFGDREHPWDPYGVAKFDLSGLLLGQQCLYLKEPIHPCALPDPLGTREVRQGDKLVGVAGAVDGPVDVPLGAGHYMESGSSLKIQVELATPLVTPAKLAAKEALHTTHQCPFARIVFIFEYKNVSFLQKLQKFVIDINAKALELEAMPPHVIEAALSTYKLSLGQQQSHSLDIITGFQVLDGHLHLFALEGLRDQAIRQLWELLPKQHNDNVEVLYHSDLAFRERLYGPLDVDLCRIKLHEPLHVIVQQPLLYVRDMLPKPCFEALIKLMDLSLMSKLRDAVRADLFPSADMVVSMSREFGVPMTAEDLEELQPQTLKVNGAWEAAQMYDMAHASRIWTPIDNLNTNYMKLIGDRTDSCSKDFEAENKDAVKQRSDFNQIERSKTAPATMKVAVTTAHNYSSQTLNSTEQANEKIRQLLAQKPERRYTYCPDSLHSMTVVPVNVEAVKKQEEQALRDHWKTPQGWDYPGKKTMQDSNVHPLKPHPARVDDLKRAWRENTLYSKFKPTLIRERYPWSQRQQDLDVWSRPDPVFGNEPITIHLAGKKLRQEKLSAALAEYETWQSRVVVDDVRSRFHRCATDTELCERGVRSSNQLDRLKGLRKDLPKKYSLKKPGFAVKDAPPLNVVLNPSVDTASREAGWSVRPAVSPQRESKVKGFVPGPYQEYSWSLERNQIPVRDYQHQLFAQEKGHDFNVYHKERSNLYKKRIDRLADEEYDTHLFRWPTQLQFPSGGAPVYELPDAADMKQRQLTRDTVDSGFVSSDTVLGLQTHKAPEIQAS